MFVYTLLMTVAVAAAASVQSASSAPRPQRALSGEGYKTLHGKHGPVADQLAAFNDLEYHAHTRFYAKSMNYNEVMSAGADVGPFNVSFQCTDAKIIAFIGIVNSNSYPITYHGNFLSGADSSAVNLLGAGEGVNLKVAEWTSSSAGNTVGAPASKGAVFLSNGYFLALSNADSYIMSVSTDDADDRMPNSDCTVAGFMEFAHPKHGQYYDGFLYEDVLLEQAAGLSGTSGTAMAGGVFAGMLMGAAVVVASTLVLTKNRSLLLHAVGYYDSFASQCTSPMEDTSSTGLTSAAAAAAAVETTQSASA